MNEFDPIDPIVLEPLRPDIPASYDGPGTGFIRWTGGGGVGAAGGPGLPGLPGLPGRIGHLGSAIPIAEAAALIDQATGGPVS